MRQPDIQPAPVLGPPKPANDKWEREHRAFLQLLPELLKTHRDRYVAIHEGKVVDAGLDLVEVAKRAYQRYGYISIYFDLVTERPFPPIRLPSPRLFIG